MEFNAGTAKEDIVPVMAAILTELCDSNENVNTPISKFHAASKPGITVLDYLQRVATYAECSDPCYIMALIYLDRIQAHPDFRVNHLNIHRLLITSIMIAAKFFDDFYYNNAFYARIGGISVKEINSLEMEFLFIVGFSVAVSEEEFNQYKNELKRHAHMEVFAEEEMIEEGDEMDLEEDDEDMQHRHHYAHQENMQQYSGYEMEEEDDESSMYYDQSAYKKSLFHHTEPDYKAGDMDQEASAAYYSGHQWVPTR